MTQNAPQRHHRISPSSLDRLAECPLSYARSLGLPDDGTITEASEYGTERHRQMAEILQSMVDPMLRQVIARPEESWFGEIEEKYGIDVNIAVLRFVSLIDDWNGGFVWQPFTLLTEQEVCIPLDMDGEPDPLEDDPMFGTIDVLCLSMDNKRALIVDWKFGYSNIPSALETLQTAAYGVGVSAMHGITDITAAIIAPHATEADRKCSVLHVVDAMGVKSLKVDVRVTVIRVLDAINNPSKYPCRQGDHCTYCKALSAGTCREALNDIGADKPIAAMITQEQPTSIVSMDNDALCELKMKCDLIEKLSKAVEDEIRRRCMEAEDKTCGPYELKEKKAAAEVTDLRGAFDVTKDFVTIDEFLEACKLSVTKLKGVYAKNAKEANFFPTKKAAEAEFDTIITPLVTEKPPTMTLSKKK